MSSRFDPARAAEALPLLLQGLTVTLQVVAAGSVIALGLGLVFALGRRLPSRALALALGGLLTFVRNTPLLVQVYFLHYYLLPALHIESSALSTGIVAIGAHYASYTAEVYRAGIEGVPRTQWEAAVALNLRRTQILRHVILPQAIPPMLPALGNYVIALFKDVPILSAIAVAELLTRALEYGAQHFRYFEVLTMVGMLYLALSLVASFVLRALERRVQTLQGAKGHG